MNPPEPAIEPLQPAPRRLRWREILVGLAVTAVFGVVLYFRVDVGDFRAHMAGADYSLVPAVLALGLLAWWFRGVRWRVLLTPFQPVRSISAFRFVVVAAMINAVVPARAGELWRAHSLGRQEGVSRSTVLGTIVVERVLDGAALALLAAVAVLTLGSSGSLTLLIAVTASLFAVCLAAAFLLTHSQRARARFLGLVASCIPSRYRHLGEAKLGLFVDGLGTLTRRRTLGVAVFLTALTWAFESAAYALLGSAFNLDINPFTYLLVVAVGNLAISVPISLGGIGPFEFFTQQALQLLGVSSALGLAYSVSIHGLMLALVAVVGLVLFVAGLGGLPAKRAYASVSSRDVSGVAAE